jgi:uncharacterized protein (TIGR02594 family)
MSLPMSGEGDFGAPEGAEFLPRRSVLFGGAAAIGASFIAPTATDAKPFDKYKDFESSTLPFPLVGGTAKPERNEQTIANGIIKRAPVRSPYAIMHYFETLRRVNKDNEAYNGGWATRWNPIIVEFFRATQTKPEGDTTSWCAASLNWTLARSHMKGGTHSASSGSFRESPGKTRHPRRGDIVVFGATDPAAFAQGRGHVGLFVAQRSDAVLVLGGNQTNPFGHHAFCRKWLDKKGKDLKLHSFHDIRAFA